ncbi:MAG: Hpt domain-containing protein [Campylobacterales bacterium]
MGITQELESLFEEEIVSEFIDHFGIMCQAMIPHIMALRQGHDIESNMDELFRIFHNIKSATGFLKLNKINKLAALAEEYLEEVRSGRKQISQELAEWLIIVADQMSDWQEDLEQDRATLRKTRRQIIRLPKTIFEQQQGDGAS